MNARARVLLGAWSLPATWCLLIFTGSSVPLRTGQLLSHGVDKVAHLGEYGVLGLLLARAVARTRPGAAGGALVLAATLLGAAWGASDEWHQSFVPERTAEWGDFAADACGSMLGAAAWLLLHRRRLRVPSPGAPAPRPSAPPGR